MYAHPLPPDAVGSEGLRYPVDQNGTQFTPSGPFQTVFLRTGGTTLDPQQALTVAPAAGAVVPNVNLAVTPRVNTTTYNVVTFSRLDSPTRSYVWNGGDTYITPAFISSSQAAALVVAQAASPAFLPNPLSVTVLGGFAPATLNSDKWPSVVPLAGFPGEVQLYLVVPIGTGIGQRHIVFNFGNDLYVLPGGLNLVPKGPPLITGVAANPDGTVTVSGAGLAADTAIYFDGIKAAVVGSFNDSQGSITVVPAAGAAPHVATVVAYNPDGQNSTILQSQNPPTYAYPVAASPQITAMNLNSLPAGATAAINITTANTNFVDGQVSVGFGSDDILVRRVWVQDATHLTANVAVASNAVLAASEISIMSGLQTITQPGGFQTLPARPGIPVINLPVTNLDATQSQIYPGSLLTFSGQGFVSIGGNPVVTLNDVPIQATVTATQVTLQVPSTFSTGVFPLKVSNGVSSSYAVMVQIDNPPAVILSVTTPAGQSLLGSSVQQGDTLNVVVAGLDPTLMTSLGRLQVTIGGVPMQVIQLTPAANGQFTIQITVTQSFGGSQVPLAVLVDGASSLPIALTVK